MAFPLYDKWLFPSVTFTPDTAAYTASDSIGGALTFDLTGSSSGGGIINSMIIADSEGIGAAGSLYIFKQDLATPIADQAVFAVAFADFANLITVLTIPTYVSLSSMKYAILTDINDVFKVTTNKLIAYLVPSGAPDWAALKSIYIGLTVLTQ